MQGLFSVGIGLAAELNSCCINGFSVLFVLGDLCVKGLGILALNTGEGSGGFAE